MHPSFWYVPQRTWRTGLLRPAARILLALLIVAGAAMVNPAAAFAIKGCPNADGWGHCYGRGAFYQYDDLHAVGVDLYVDCLHVENRDTDFINFEMWLRTRANEPGDTWVESGMTAGTLYASPGREKGFVWYWADAYAATGGYFEHYIGAASAGRWTNVTFRWEGNNMWGVFNGGRRVGGSGVGPYPSTSYVGAEATTDRVALNGKARSWQYFNRAETTWRWASPASDVTHALSVNAIVSQGSVDSWTPRWACGGPPPAIAEANTVAPAADIMQAVSSAANRVAAANGELKPSAMRYVKSTRQAAARTLSAADVETNESVYVVEMAGTFTKSGLQGGAKIAGSSMMVVVNAVTGEVTDWGISRSPSGKLSVLGSPSAL